MQGASYNLVLILAPLTFWAAVKWRFLAAAAVRAWRAWRHPQTDLSPDLDLDDLYSPLPQVSAPRDGAGDTPRRGSGGGLGEVPGERVRPVVETLGDGTHGVWIKVGRGAGDDGPDEVIRRG